MAKNTTAVTILGERIVLTVDVPKYVSKAGSHGSHLRLLVDSEGNRSATYVRKDGTDEPAETNAARVGNFLSTLEAMTVSDVAPEANPGTKKLIWE